MSDTPKWICPHDGTVCDESCQYWDGRETCQTDETIRAMEDAGHWRTTTTPRIPQHAPHPISAPQ